MLNVCKTLSLKFSSKLSNLHTSVNSFKFYDQILIKIKLNTKTVENFRHLEQFIKSRNHEAFE